MDRETQSITLKITDKRIKTTIFRKDEEYIKEIEKHLNDLWENFKISKPGMPKDDYLALVAFQYAKLYFDTATALQEREEELKKFIKEYEKSIDDIILNVT